MARIWILKKPDLDFEEAGPVEADSDRPPS